MTDTTWEATTRTTPRGPTTTTRFEPGPDYEAVLARVDGRARLDLQRHADALDALQSRGPARTWRGLVAALGGLAGHAIKTVGPGATQFFVADGRYRLQLFALEDRGGGLLHVFLPDVLETALARGLIVATPLAGHYAAGDDPTVVLAAEPVDAHGTVGPPPHVKFMVGLSRTAVRLTVAATGDPAQVRLACALCELAASLNVPATSRPQFPV